MARAEPEAAATASKTRGRIVACTIIAIGKGPRVDDALISSKRRVWTTAGYEVWPAVGPAPAAASTLLQLHRCTRAALQRIETGRKAADADVADRMGALVVHLYITDGVAAAAQ